uniref:Uncharacterized protein n=1 Tax=Arundo donax TaxID=35708 RepID=A0A0A9PXA4_ARUDO
MRYLGCWLVAVLLYTMLQNLAKGNLINSSKHLCHNSKRYVIN